MRRRELERAAGSLLAKPGHAVGIFLPGGFQSGGMGGFVFLGEPPGFFVERAGLGEPESGKLLRLRFPLLIPRPRGGFKLLLDAHLLGFLLQTGLLKATVEQPPRPGQIAGKLRGGRSGGVRAKKINEPYNHERDESGNSHHWRNCLNAEARTEQTGGGQSQQQHGDEPEGKVFENQRHRDFFKPFQTRARFGFHFLKLLKQLIGVWRKIRLRPLPCGWKQSLKFSAAPKRAAHRLAQSGQRGFAVRQFFLKIPGPRRSLGQVVIARAFDARRLFAEVVAEAALPLVDFLLNAFAGGLMGAGDGGRAPLMTGGLTVDFLRQGQLGGAPKRRLG